MTRKSKKIKRRFNPAKLTQKPAVKKTDTKKPPTVKLSLGKKILFSCLAFCVFFVCLELLLAVAGVKPALYSNDSYVGFSSYIPLFVKTTAPDGSEMMVTATNKIKFFNSQQFPPKKSPGTYRIFCMGGSTTFGRPYDDLTSFCGWLREMLPKADPSRNWEVINAGGISYASYRVALLMEELQNYSPDLFIIYSGQNEFLEKRTYSDIIDTPSAVQGISAIVSRTRTYTAVKKVINTVSDKSKNADKPNTTLTGEVNTILDNSVGPEAYQRDDELTQQILSHYHYNLSRMADIAKNCDAKILYVTPASNLRDCQPFKSQHASGLTEPQIKQCMQFYDTASDAYAAGKLDSALTSVEQAIKIDPRYAQFHYLHGQILWRLQRYSEAKDAFVNALNEDICPLRALGPMENIVTQVASERKAMLVDFAALTDQLSAHSTPGEDLFLDHVHPTIDMHKKLALAILDKMQKQNIVKLSPNWSDETIRQISTDIESKIDPAAQGRALRNLAQVLRWAGKFDEAKKLAAKAVDLVSDDAEAQYLLAGDVTAIPPQQLPQAIEHLRKALQIEPGYVMAHNSMGIALSRLGNLDLAIKHFEYALKIEPQNSQALNSLGITVQTKGRLDLAESYFRKAIAADPKFATAYSNLGNVMQLKGDTDQAIDYYKKSLALLPNVVKGHYNLGGLLLMQGKDTPALEQFKQALNIDPDYAKAHLAMGSIYQNRSEYNKAIEHYQKTLKFDPGLIVAHYQLYEVYTQTNQPALAAKQLKLYNQAASKQSVNERRN